MISRYSNVSMKEKLAKKIAGIHEDSNNK
jgi:hypothetical protein